MKSLRTWKVTTCTVPSAVSVSVAAPRSSLVTEVSNRVESVCQAAVSLEFAGDMSSFVLSVGDIVTLVGVSTTNGEFISHDQKASRYSVKLLSQSH